MLNEGTDKTKCHIMTTQRGVNVQTKLSKFANTVC